MTRRMRLKTVLLVAATALLAGAVAQRVNAQDEEGFRLGATTAFCYPGHPGPFIGCTPWEGVTVSVESDDGQYADSCTTVADPYNDPPRYASCTFFVPFGSTIIASIDPAAIPDGYYLASGDPVQQWDIPDGPPTGLFGGPTFILYPDEDTGSEDTPSDGDVVEELPNTGSGSTADVSGDNSLATAMLLLISLIVVSGVRIVIRFPR